MWREECIGSVYNTECCGKLCVVMVPCRCSPWITLPSSGMGSYWSKVMLCLTILGFSGTTVMYFQSYQLANYLRSDTKYHMATVPYFENFLLLADFNSPPRKSATVTRSKRSDRRWTQTPPHLHCLLMWLLMQLSAAPRLLFLETRIFGSVFSPHWKCCWPGPILGALSDLLMSCSQLLQ